MLDLSWFFKYLMIGSEKRRLQMTMGKISHRLVQYLLYFPCVADPGNVMHTAAVLRDSSSLRFEIWYPMETVWEKIAKMENFAKLKRHRKILRQANRFDFASIVLDFFLLRLSWRDFLVFWIISNMKMKWPLQKSDCLVFRFYYLEIFDLGYHLCGWKAKITDLTHPLEWQN